VTSLLFDAARRALADQGFDARSAGIGIAVVLLLVALVVERELLRGFGGSAAAPARLQALGVVIGPLLVAFAFIVGVRFGHLL
jgi:hypothetical protein